LWFPEAQVAPQDNGIFAQRAGWPDQQATVAAALDLAGQAKLGARVELPQNAVLLGFPLGIYRNVSRVEWFPAHAHRQGFRMKLQ
jgi:hypothetical protein